MVRNGILSFYSRRFLSPKLRFEPLSKNIVLQLNDVEEFGLKSLEGIFELVVFVA